MQDTVLLCELFDVYGALLSARQQEVFSLRYTEDLSLAEIAEELGVSRQGVHENILRAEAHLQKMEERTGSVRRYLQSREARRNILSSAETLKNHSDPAVRKAAMEILAAACSSEE